MGSSLEKDARPGSANGRGGDASSALELELRNVQKRYPGSREAAIPDLSLTVPAGEVCVLVGPSGSGKTTAMRLINRMIPLSGGDILLGGRSVLEREETELRREIGYVIQQIGLFPHLTVYENIATVPKLLGWSKERIEPRVHELLELISLDARGRRPLPAAALRRAAPAGRRRPRARRRSAADADGRAVWRDRPDQPRDPAGRLPGVAAAGAQDGRVRDPRHRRGDQARRPHRDPARGRDARAVRDPGGDPRQPGR